MKDVIIKHYENKTLGKFLSSEEYRNNESYTSILIGLHENGKINLIHDISSILKPPNERNTCAVILYVEIIKEISLNYDEMVFVLNYLKTICEQRYKYDSLYGLLSDALETKTITELDKLYDDAINSSELYEYTYFILKMYLKIDARKAHELAVNLFSQCNADLFIACSNVVLLFDYKNLGFDKLNDVMQLLLQRQTNLLSMNKESSKILCIASQIYESYSQNSEQFFLKIFDCLSKFHEEGHSELLDQLKFFHANMSPKVWGKYSQLVLEHPSEKNLGLLLSNNYSFLESESFRLTYIKLIEELLISNKIQDNQLKDFYQIIQYHKLQDALMTRWLLSKNQMLIYVADNIFYGVALDATANFDASLLEGQVQDQSMFFNLIDHCCGAFYLYPNIAVSFLLSLLDLNIDPASELRMQLHIRELFIPSYPYAVEDILVKIQKNTDMSYNEIIDNIRKDNKKYLDFLTAIKVHKELSEDLGNKQLRFSEQNRQESRISKQVNSQSVFHSLFTKSLILYGRGCRQTYSVTTPIDNVFHTHSVRVDFPNLEVISPVETKQFLFVLNAYCWGKDEINN